MQDNIIITTNSSSIGYNYQVHVYLAYMCQNMKVMRFLQQHHTRIGFYKPFEGSQRVLWAQHLQRIAGPSPSRCSQC